MDAWGLIKVAAAVPEVVIAAPKNNMNAIIALAEEAAAAHCHVVCFPELCVCAYTAADLFFQSKLQTASDQALLRLAEASERWPELTLIVGAPLYHLDRLYNAAFVIQGGEIAGAVPKRFLPNHNEFYEARWFAPGEDAAAVCGPLSQVGCADDEKTYAVVGERAFPFGPQLFELAQRGAEFSTSEKIYFGIEICEDLWAPEPPSTRQALAGAALIFNLSASNELVGKAAYRRELIVQQSARLNAAYIYAAADSSESTTDLVFGGHCLVAENGKLLAERPPLSERGRLLTAVIDTEILRSERLHNAGFSQTQSLAYRRTEMDPVDFKGRQVLLLAERRCAALPFVPLDADLRADHADQVLNIQTAGLVKRLRHTGIKRCVIGVSGGLDSTLALLVTVRAYRKLAWPLTDIHGITMPGFGTTDRTYQNALQLMEALGLSTQEISIVAAVTQHFKDIGQDSAQHDITYENSQARERTQILMDYANRIQGLVIGTGDLSELALGWCTYNGDHMSMYGVNASVPKTLVRHLLSHQAELFGRAALAGDEISGKVSAVLRDILATPISPELLPPAQDGGIAQITEDSTGPYILNDFFLYHALRYGLSPEKIFYMARQTFSAAAPRPALTDLPDPSLAVPIYDEATLLHWLDRFYQRFFSQQFKRSCLPDGPKVGAISLSPRGDWRMPSDAVSWTWRHDLELLKIHLKLP